MYDYRRLKRIAEVEFPDIVVATEIIRQRKLRIIIIDSSYVDIFYSPDSTNRHFAYHWESAFGGFLDGTFYRHDNIPDGNWKNVASFPKHFHNGQYENVQESNISDDTAEALRYFLIFVRKKLEEIGK